MSLSEKRLASMPRRRMNTLTKQTEEMSSAWDGLDGGVMASFEDLYQMVDKVISDLNFVQYEKEKERAAFSE